MKNKFDLDGFNIVTMVLILASMVTIMLCIICDTFDKSQKEQTKQLELQLQIEQEKNK